MKNIRILIILSLLIFAAAANAQPRITPQDRLERFKERLSLTKDQATKVEIILVNADKEIQKLRSSENMDRSEFRKIMDNANQEIEKILNDKQKTEFKKMLGERRKSRQGNSSSSVN